MHINIEVLTAEEEKEIKINKAIELSSIHKGTETVNNVLSRIPSQIIDDCAPVVIACVMDAINKAYHDGRASTGAEMMDSNTVWINNINRAIEWIETGAECETKVEDMGCKRTYGVKIKNGVLTPRFCEV